MNKETMAERVKIARTEAGYKTQEAIADAMGMTRDAYARYETGRPIPTERLPGFCDLTNISERWLLTGEGPKNKGAHSDLYDLLDQAQREYVKRSNDFAADMIEALKRREKE